MFPGMPEEERIRRYAVFGGTPFYLSFAVEGDLGEAVQRALLRRDAPLLGEPERLVEKEFSEPALPNSILSEIGRGAHAIGDLESRIGADHSGLGYHLRLLADDMDLVAREEPVMGRQRLGHYVLPDPFFRFYYRFVFDRRGRLERGQGRDVWTEIETDLESHVGFVFEDIVREFLSTPREVRGVRWRPQEVGRWWDRRGQEIDLVARGEKEVWAVEVTWSARPVGPAVVQELLKKLPLLDRLEGAPIRPVVVARGGITTEARAALASRGGISLDLEDLRRGFGGGAKGSSPPSP